MKAEKRAAAVRVLQRLQWPLLAAAAALALAGAAVWLAQRPWFEIRHLELRAADGGVPVQVHANEIRAALAGRLHGNFFTLSLDEARRLIESVPWVAAASVRRAWPDRLQVTVTEHRAIGLWDDGRLLADSGRLFVANVAEAELAGALLQVEAPPRHAAEVARRAPAFAAALERIGLVLEAIEVSERAGWTLRSDSGMTIELGRDDPAGRLDERLALVTAHYPAFVAQLNGSPARIDARYPQGFAVAANKRP